MSPCSICGGPHTTDSCPLKIYSKGKIFKEKDVCNVVLSLAKKNYNEMKKEYDNLVAAYGDPESKVYNMFVINQKIQSLTELAEKINCPNLKEIQEINDLAANLLTTKEVVPYLERAVPGLRYVIPPPYEAKPYEIYPAFEDIKDPDLLRKIRERFAFWSKKYSEAGRTKGKKYSEKEIFELIDCFGKVNVALVYGLPNEVFEEFLKRIDKGFCKDALKVEKEPTKFWLVPR
jgi:hypothetical protein